MDDLMCIVGEITLVYCLVGFSIWAVGGDLATRHQIIFSYTIYYLLMDDI